VASVFGVAHRPHPFTVILLPTSFSICLTDLCSVVRLETPKVHFYELLEHDVYKPERQSIENTGEVDNTRLIHVQLIK